MSVLDLLGVVRKDPDTLLVTYYYKIGMSDFVVRWARRDGIYVLQTGSLAAKEHIRTFIDEAIKNKRCDLYDELMCFNPTNIRVIHIVYLPISIKYRVSCSGHFTFTIDAERDHQSKEILAEEAKVRLGYNKVLCVHNMPDGSIVATVC